LPEVSSTVRHRGSSVTTFLLSFISRLFDICVARQKCRHQWVVARIDVKIISPPLLSQPASSLQCSTSVEIGQSEIRKSAPLSARLVQGFRFQRHDIPHVNHNPYPESTKWMESRCNGAESAAVSFQKTLGPVPASKWHLHLNHRDLVRKKKLM